MKSVKEPIIAPSVLSSDFSNVAAGLTKIEKSGAHWVHLDVMDGRFVPNITFGPKMVQDIRKRTSLPLDVHLMVAEPERFFSSFSQAGADYITFHLEASVHADRAVHSIKELGKNAGISIVPSTKIEALEYLLPSLDLVLIMSVNPGFGGQSFIPYSLDKIRRLDKFRKDNGLNFKISVDGGVNRDTVKDIREAGADVLVTGSAFFSAADPVAEVNFLKGHPTV